MKRTLLNPSFNLPRKPRNTLSTVTALFVILGYFSISFSTTTGYAALDPTLPEPLIKLGTLLTEEKDGAYQYWHKKQKFFLIVAVEKTKKSESKGTTDKEKSPNIDLPFTLVDAKEIQQTLTAQGYQPLDPQHPILSGEKATGSYILEALTKAHAQPVDQEDIILVYFTGHGIRGGRDLWLQTFGQAAYKEGQGIPLSQLIHQIRQKDGESAFEGQLYVIIDACSSGAGTLSKGLTLEELGKETTIFTSSSQNQTSLPLNPPLPRMSAFTYAILQGMGSDWVKADHDHDGILRFEEMRIYVSNQLRSWSEKKLIDGHMDPSWVGNQKTDMLAYRRDQVRVRTSPYRTALQTKEVSKALGANLQTLGANPKEKPELPQAAKALAKGLDPDPQDFYAQFLQATADKRMKDARVLFAKAEEQSQQQEQVEENSRQEALKQQQEAEAAKQIERDKRYDLYLDRARMETYDGKFTEAFTWYQKTADLRPPEAPDLINEIGLAGLRAGKYPQAEPYLQQALQQREQDLDPKHPDIGMSLNNLAGLYQAQGKYAEAEPLLQNALRIREATLGPNHPDLAVSLNNLAELYRTQGKYAQAEPLLQNALRIREATLGPNHPDLAVSLNNLAELYRTQGKYAQAEPLYQRALRINEQALGTDHPDVALNLNNLALLYKTQGKYAQAEPLYQRALRIREATLGPNHPDVAQSLNNLAGLYQAQGKYAEAEPLYQRALRINEAALNINHPHLGISLNNLAELYRTQGKYAEAEPLYQRALRITETALGPDHPSVAIRLNNLAELYRIQGKYDEAELLYQRSYWIFLRTLGSDHPNVATVFENYQDLLKTSGQASDKDAVTRKLQKAQDSQASPVFSSAP